MAEPDFRSRRRAVVLGLVACAFAAGVRASHIDTKQLFANAKPLLVQATPLPVVATFSVLGDMTRQIGGEHIKLTTIVGPGADSHSFEPTPQDVKALSEAKVLILNGVGFEGWLPRMIKAAGFDGMQVLATRTASLRHLDESEQAHNDPNHNHGDTDVDPHAWQDLRNGMIYAQNIADGLSQADPAHRAYNQKRAKAYIAQMKKIDTEIRMAFAEIPESRRKVISSHDAFGYFAAAYGIKFIPVVGLSNEAEPSAHELAALIKQVKKENVAGVFVESTANPKIIRQIARETGAKIGGTLYSDSLAKPDEPASTYLGMFSWNAGRLIYVLKPGN
jgi:zinc/manganese transport system substrate-binding protein